MHGKRQRNVLLYPRFEGLAVHRYIFAELIRGIDQRRGKDRHSQSPGNGEGVRAVGGETNRWMGFLQGFRNHGQIFSLKVFPAIREALIRPGFENHFERFLEPLAALFLRYVITNVMDRRGSAAHPELEASAAENIRGRRFLSYFYWTVQRQGRDRSAEADALSALRRCRQHHEGTSKDRGTAAEVQLPKPYGIESQRVPKLHLCKDVLVALALRL